MSLLNRRFDVVRGWSLDNGDNYAIPIDYDPTPAGTPPVYLQGTVVVIDKASGKAVPANLVGKAASKMQPYLVQTGEDDYDGNYTRKLNGIERNVKVVLDPPCYDVSLGPWSVNDDLTAKDGKFIKAAAADQVIARVTAVQPDGLYEVQYYGLPGPV